MQGNQLGAIVWRAFTWWITTFRKLSGGDNYPRANCPKLFFWGPLSGGQCNYPRGNYPGKQQSWGPSVRRSICLGGNCPGAIIWGQLSGGIVRWRAIILGGKCPGQQLSRGQLSQNNYHIVYKTQRILQKKHISICNNQKQPPEVFCKKRCSQKFRKIHSKTPVPEYLF